MATGKSIALTLRTFVGQVMSLLFKMLPWAALYLLHTLNCLWVSLLLEPEGELDFSGPCY